MKMVFRQRAWRRFCLPGPLIRSVLGSFSEYSFLLEANRTKPYSVNPTGCNPSGCSHSVEKKLAILKVCKKYELLILEGELAETYKSCILMFR